MLFVKNAIKNFRKFNREFSKNKFCYYSSFQYQTEGVEINTIEDRKKFLQTSMKLLEKNDFVISDKILQNWYTFFTSDKYKKPELNESLHIDAVTLSLAAQVSKNCGRIDIAKEQFKKAKEMFEEVKGEKDLPSILAIGYSATLYAEEKDYQSAKENIIFALKYHPKDRVLLSSLAISHIFLSEIGSAEDVYQILLKETPNDSILLSEIAGFYSTYKKDYQKAEQYYKKSLELCEDDNVLTSYGQMLFELVRVEESEKLFKRAIEINPNNYLAYSNLGTLYLAIEQKDKARENYLCSIKIYQLDSLTLSQYGYLLHKEGKLDEAKTYFEKAINAEPFEYQEVAIYINFASLLMEKNELDYAEHIFYQGLKLDPNDYSLLGNFAVFCHEKRNDFEKAEEYFKKSLSFKGQEKAHAFKANSLNYIKLLINLKKFKDADQIFIELLKHHGDKEMYVEYYNFKREHF